MSDRFKRFDPLQALTSVDITRASEPETDPFADLDDQIASNSPEIPVSSIVSATSAPAFNFAAFEAEPVSVPEIPDTSRELPARVDQAIGISVTEVYGRLPYINDHGDLIVPLDTPPDYRHWCPGGKSIDAILRELNAPPEIMRRYVGGYDKQQTT